MLVLIEHHDDADQASRGNLGARECQQRSDVVIIGGLQGGDVALAHRAGILQIGTAPRKPLTPEPYH
jgi:hypothetical protein